MTEKSATQPTSVVAFSSPGEGTGRSCMIANIALMLASQGQRVLIVDLDLAGPSLYRYLSPFLPDGPVGASGNSPVRLLSRFLDPRGLIDFIGPLSDEPAEAGPFTVSRPGLTGRDYDTVLIDAPAPVADGPAGVDVADVVVLGFLLNKHHMERGVQLAELILENAPAPPPQVLPVPMRVDQDAGRFTSNWRAMAHRQFDWLLGDMTEGERQQYWSEIEVPYQPEYSVEERLPFLDQPSAARDRLVDAYLRVARLLVPGLAEAVPPAVTEQTLLRYRDAHPEAASQASTVTVVHAAADRLWAERIGAALQSTGFTVVRRRINQSQAGEPPAHPVLVVVSACLLALPGLESLLRDAFGLGLADGRTPVGVSVDGRWLPGDLFPTLAKIDLARKSPKDAYDEIAAYFQAPDPGQAARAAGHFPAERDTLRVNVPAHSRQMVGRDDVVDQIRDHFTTSPAGRPLTLTGVPGTGKTLVALEYAHRFAADYDMIVLIRADSAEAMRVDLAAFAEMIPPQRPAGDAGTAALKELWSLAPPRRWLLIYTRADHPAGLGQFLPDTGLGHVLVTSREAVANGSAQLIVPPISPEDARAMVSGAVEAISPADAAWVAEAMGGIPLALQLACAWLRRSITQASRWGAALATVTEDAVSEFRSRLAGVDEAVPAAVADPVQQVVSLHLEGLGSGPLGHAAALLLETCAFLGSCGLSWRLLRSPAMLDLLAEADPEMADPILLSSVLQEIASHGLLVLDDTAMLPGDMTGLPLRVHPRVLAVVRERMMLGQRASRMRQVSRVLAASAPLGVDDDVINSQAVYAELLQHVTPSGAASQLDEVVRRWLVNEVRFLWLSDSRSLWAAAAELGEGLEATWQAELPGEADDRRNDRLLLQLRTQLANVYRSQGDFARARVMDEETLARQRSVLGLLHPRTLMTARSLGADLRLVGEFELALLEDNATWQATVRSLGRNHLLSVTMSGNLALSELLAGDLEQALQRREEFDLPWYERFPRPWQSAWILSQIGALQRELGRYKQSLDSLTAARELFLHPTNGDTPALVSVPALRTLGGIAIARRRLGNPDPKTNEDALDECLRYFGPNYELVPAIMLSQAGDLHAIQESAAAVRLAREALRRHEGIFGDHHPFTLANQVDLGSYALHAGDLDLAEDMSQAALAGLEQSLGGPHLWTLAAAVTRGNVLAVTGRLDAAAELETRAVDGYRERLGADHPFTKLAKANAHRTRSRQDEDGPVAEPVGEAAHRREIELDIPPH